MQCAAACPRHLIVSVPVSKKVFVECANKQKGPAAMKVCDNACIGCGLCVKECKFDAIHVVDNVAVIDYASARTASCVPRSARRTPSPPSPPRRRRRSIRPEESPGGKEGRRGQGCGGGCQSCGERRARQGRELILPAEKFDWKCPLRLVPGRAFCYDRGERG